MFRVATIEEGVATAVVVTTGEGVATVAVVTTQVEATAEAVSTDLLIRMEDIAVEDRAAFAAEEDLNGDDIGVWSLVHRYVTLSNRM